MTEANGPDQVATAPVKRGRGRPRKIKQEAQAPVTTQNPPPEAPIMVAVGTADNEAPSGVINRKTTFFLGTFASRSNTTDPEAVRLSVQGETITFKRGVDTIVPEPYLEVARHARYPKFTQEPGHGRKIIGFIDRFPFSVKREATYDEFRKAFTAGSKETREAVARHGLTIPVEDSIPQLS